MDSLCRPYGKVKQVACYKFGLGKPIRFYFVWIYQFGIMGDAKELWMAEIPRECLGLRALDDTAAWRMDLAFFRVTPHFVRVALQVCTWPVPSWFAVFLGLQIHLQLYSKFHSTNRNVFRPSPVAPSDADVDPTRLTLLSKCKFEFAALAPNHHLWHITLWVSHIPVKHWTTCLRTRFFTKHHSSTRKHSDVPMFLRIQQVVLQVHANHFLRRWS